VREIIPKATLPGEKGMTRRHLTHNLDTIAGEWSLAEPTRQGHTAWRFVPMRKPAFLLFIPSRLRSLELKG